MVDRSLLWGHSFLTTLDLRSEPVWKPLEDLAKQVSEVPGMPRFHPGEFMYMAAVRNEQRKVTIHLYKHYDTRRYINLDDAGRAYAYQPRFTDPDDLSTGGRYRRYRNLDDAVHHLDLDAFETIGLWRSFPPEVWPPDE